MSEVRVGHSGLSRIQELSRQTDPDTDRQDVGLTIAHATRSAYGKYPDHAFTEFVQTASTAYRRPSADSSNAFFRMKDGKIIKFDQGMAMFSPESRYFWFTPYDGGTIKVYATATGKLIGSFSGCDPAWSPDSKRIYTRNCFRTCIINSERFSETERVEGRDILVKFPHTPPVQACPLIII